MNTKNTLILTLPILASLAGCTEDAKVDTTTNTISAASFQDTAGARRHYQRGLDLLREKKIDQAGEQFKLAVEADIMFGPAHNNLGKVYYMQNDFHAAAWEFEYARELLPRNPEPLSNIGLCYEQDGQFDRAVEYYRQAVALAPDEIQFRALLVRALLKRGDRTEEVRNLLEDILREDTRPEWLIMAKQYLSRMNP